MIPRRILALSLLVPAALLVGTASTPSFAQQQTLKTRKVVKTEEQWAKQLTRDQFQVTRLKATEPAFSGRYATSHGKGVYSCVCCGAPLFSSQTKFDSGTGWPSFWRPIDPKRIESAPDNHGAEPRVEVLCQDCGAHLGHVFDDGPAPTGLRYCINSLSLKLVPPTASTGTAPAKKATRASEKTKARGKARSGSRGDGDTPKTSPPDEPRAAPKADDAKAPPGR